MENPHVISSNQIWAGVVPEGPSGYVFNSSYQNRDVLEYKQELGNAIGMLIVSIYFVVYVGFRWCSDGYKCSF